MTLRSLYVVLSEKDIHIGRFFQEAKSRAQNKNVPFTVTLKYLREMAGDHCPVFGHKFVWGRSHLGKGKTTGDSPSLDRIIPELGYVPGNVVFISHNANRIKNNATEKELYAVADWLHEARKKVNVNEKSAASLSTGDHQQSEVYPELGPFSATGTWEDYYDAHHYCGANARQDADNSTQASSGDSMGSGSAQVGTFVTSYDIQNNGLPCAENILAEYRGRRIPDKS